ncbi:MAG: MFS transporter [Proteobacteria bacterium]|nr:MFS transporter [Pseudomonadota bacterium]
MSEANLPQLPGTLREVLAQTAFVRYLLARFVTSLAVQIQTVAVGLQVYELSHRPLDLGLIGLSQFLPFLVFVLPAGQAADRWNRRTILLGCFVLELLCAAALVGLTWRGLVSAVPVFAVMVPFGIARALMAPAGQAILPNLVPRRLFSNAIGINSSMWQLSAIVGPAVGGVLYAHFGPAIVYEVVVALFAVAVLATLTMAAPRQVPAAERPTWHAVVEGLRFVWRRHIVLGAISLDLFAVLFGGATALLPAFATDVLGIGPTGYGWLRAAPGIGAALMGAWLTVRPISRHVGRAMFAGVVVFGIATVVFALSRSYLLSVFALAVLGAADMVSMFVRHMLVQLETPDEMRGRVGAVNSMFIGGSSELGEFESGLTAAWWGLVPAVLVGGLATLAVAWAWRRWFPELAGVDRFHQS